MFAIWGMCAIYGYLSYMCVHVVYGVMCVLW